MAKSDSTVERNKKREQNQKQKYRPPYHKKKEKWFMQNCEKFTQNQQSLKKVAEDPC